MSLVGTEISGENFNKVYDNTIFYKFLYDDLTHYGMTYKEGLNEDILEFNPSRRCARGGLYFCDEINCRLFWRMYENKMALVKIPDDARVYIEEGKFKANKIIITQIIDFKDVPDTFWVKLLYDDGHALRCIQNQTYELCVLAIKQNANSIQYVKEEFLTEDIIMLAVQRNGRALEHIKNRTNEICTHAVQQNGMALMYVADQTEEICKLAVMQNGFALQYVINQTEEICKLAILQNNKSLYYVKEQNEEICKFAVQLNGLVLEYVNCQFKTDEICKIAVQQNGLSLQYVKNQTNDICTLAIRQNKSAFAYVDNDLRYTILFKLRKFEI